MLVHPYSTINFFVAEKSQQNFYCSRSCPILKGFNSTKMLPFSFEAILLTADTGVGPALIERH